MMEEIMTGSRRVDNFDGDVNVQHSLNVGARAKINGSAGIKGNLHVGGMLMSELVSSKCMGIFETEAELKAAHPNPQKGMYAGVGFDFDKADKMPKLYVCKKDGEWYNTGKTFTNEATAAFEEAMQSVFEAHEEARQAEFNTNEQTRQANENQRIANENARQAAEAARELEITTIKEQLTSVTTKANTAESVAKGVVRLAGIDNLNTRNSIGLYKVALVPSGASPYGMLMVAQNYVNWTTQFYFGSLDPTDNWSGNASNHRIYARHYYDGAWSEWDLIACEGLVAKVNSLVDAANRRDWNIPKEVRPSSPDFNNGGGGTDAGDMGGPV